MRLLVINGPNLDLLGTREPDVYGSTTLGELESSIRQWAGSLGLDVDLLQSNHEGEVIDAIHESDHDGIVINPGALTHTSRALADAVRGIRPPVVEVHISNVLEREPWRTLSVLEGAVVKKIYGRGVGGYRDALRHLVNRSRCDVETVVYGPHREQVADLRQGGGDLVVLVHGGFWRNEWALDTMETLAADLTERGFDTLNIEYRRIGAGGGWPGAGHDVQTALETTGRLGYSEVAAVIGHSAGAQLALWAMPRSDVAVGRLIALAPVTDLTMHAEAGGPGSAEARSLLDDGAPPGPGPVSAPILVVHGREDRQVAFAQSAVFAQDAMVELMETEERHFGLLDPRRAHWGEVLRHLEG